MVPELAAVADEIRKGQQAQPTTVRIFLSWFGASRRGYWIVKNIREQMNDAGVITVPDFESTWIDGPIHFERPSASEATSAGGADDETGYSTPSGNGAESVVQTSIRKDATYRISKLESANKKPVSIKPDGTITEAITLLMERGFSQLPVMPNERDVKGIISWKSIGSRFGLPKAPESAREAMETHRVIESHFSIFDAIPIIKSSGYVLVRGTDGRISGIITASDLSEQFHVLTEPFLLLGEIENLIRNLIDGRFSSEELNEGRNDPDSDKRKLDSVSDMMFGDYERLLQNPDRWKKLEMPLDSVVFCKRLASIRKIRNGLMHFDPDGITTDQLHELRDFTAFLQQIHVIFS